MREIRPYGSEGGEDQTNDPSLPLSDGLSKGGSVPRRDRTVSIVGPDAQVDATPFSWA
jgi:hypothetical protein